MNGFLTLSDKKLETRFCLSYGQLKIFWLSEIITWEMENAQFQVRLEKALLDLNGLAYSFCQIRFNPN